MAIVYVIMVVAVVTVVTVTIWQATEHEVRSVAREELKSQAYYYARSGVEIAVGYIMENLDNEEIFNSNGTTYYGKLGQIPFSTSIPVDAYGREDYNIMFNIAIEKTGEEVKYLIQSTGFAGNVGADGSSGTRASANALGFEITHDALEKSVEGGLGGEVGPDIPPIVSNDYTTNYAVFTKELIDLNSGSPVIRGDIGTNSGPVLMNYSSHVYNLENGDGSIYLGPGAEINYPQWRTKDWEEVRFQPELQFPPVPQMPAAPEAPDYPEIPDGSGVGYTSDITSSKTVTLTSGGTTKYKNVNLGWNDVLTFSMQGDAAVIIENFSSSGEIRLTGQGKLLLVIKDDIDGSRTLINRNGDPSRLTLYVDGSNVSFQSGGDGSAVSGAIFAPNADLTAVNTDINGDIIIGGDTLYFSGVSHNGALYALNENAEIGYNGNRDLVPGTNTFIFTNGRRLTIAPAHLQGVIYLTNPKAQVDLGSSSTFRGNILTHGSRIDVSGSAVLKGHIVAPNPNAEICFTGGADHEGAVITGGKKLSFSGGTLSMRGILFAPDADFELKGGAMIYGSITSKTLVAEGGSSVSFEKVVYDDLPVVLDPTEVERAEANWRVYGTWVAN